MRQSMIGTFFISIDTECESWSGEIISLRRFQLFISVLLCVSSLLHIDNPASAAARPTVTVMCYLNGDNNLSVEVLNALDMMETVGSSPQVNIIALVDGHPQGSQPYGTKWSGTHLVHVLADQERGRIVSPIIESYGERNLGEPDTLTDFVRTSRQRFPADRYIFCTFAHGKGIINTDHFAGFKTYKSLSISSDETNHAIMTHSQFQKALSAGLAGEKFDLMVMFSCLTNMVEIAYSLRDVTRYLVASEDEIRLLNDPPGTYQLRGIAFEDFLKQLQTDPEIQAPDLARHIIDLYIEPYNRKIKIVDTDGSARYYQFSAGLSLIDTQSLTGLASRLDQLTQIVTRRLNSEPTAMDAIRMMHAALAASQSYQSFMNLEYYDLTDLLQNWQRMDQDGTVRRICAETLRYIKEKVILYARHTRDCRSNGISIYLSNYLVPENIYRAHQRLYLESEFSRDTSWVRLIETYRKVMIRYYPDILIDQCALAYAKTDIDRFERLSCRIIWALRHQIQNGRHRTARRYVDLLASVNPLHVPRHCLYDFQHILQSNRSRPAFADLSRQIALMLENTGARRSSPKRLSR